MKVLFLAPNFPPEVHAGTEMAVSALGAALQRRGVEVFVVASSDHQHDGVDVSAEEYAGMRVARVRKTYEEWDQSKLFRPRLVELIDAFVASERPDVVHNHSMSVYGVGHATRALQRGVPTVTTCHDLWVTCARYFRLPPIDVRCPVDTDRRTCATCVNHTLERDEQEVHGLLVEREREICAEAAATRVLAAPSRTAAQLVERCMPSPRPVAVVPHGLLADPATVRRALPRQAGERLRVGTFGNLVEVKGVLELVRAVAGIDCELHMSGSFLDVEFARRVRALADEHGVALCYHGPYGPDVAHPAERLHLAVFPSKCQETYGLVVDEALARGVPTVVSDNGALAERGAIGGVVVTPIAGLAGVLRDLCRDGASLARLAAAVPAQLPTIDDSAARYLELYDAALTSR